MKRFRLLLGLLLIVVLLVSCSAFAANVTTVKYWLWMDDVTDQTIPNLIKEYNSAHPGVNVVMETVPLAQYHDKLINAISAGAAPDVTRFKDWWLGEFAKAQLVEPLTSYLNKWPARSDVIPKLWDSGKIPGSKVIYMVPHNFVTIYLYYRADWFKEAGLEPPTTYDKFLTAAQKLTDPAKNRYGFGLRGGAGGQDAWLAFMAAQGVRLTDKKGNVIINNQKAVDANQKFIDLFRKYKVTPPSAPTDAFAQITGAFQAGNTAMFEHHVGSSAGFAAKFGANLGVVSLPAADPKKPATMETMSGHIILASSKVKKEAFQFITWLTSADQMDKWSRSPGNGQLPVLQSVANRDFYKNNIFYKTSIDSASTAIGWPATPGVGKLSATTWAIDMQRALLGEITSKQMLDDLAKDLKEN